MRTHDARWVSLKSQKQICGHYVEGGGSIRNNVCTHDARLVALKSQKQRLTLILVEKWILEV